MGGLKLETYQVKAYHEAAHLRDADVRLGDADLHTDVRLGDADLRLPEPMIYL